MVRGFLAPRGIGRQVADPFALLRREVEQLFDGVGGTPSRAGGAGTVMANYPLIERPQGSFQRTVRLPYPVDPSQVQARFNDGVLTVTLPTSGTRQGAQCIEVARGTSQTVDSASDGGDTRPH